MGLEKYCSKKLTGTYSSTHQNGDRSYGGYALYNRVPAHFAIKIPDGISSAAAVPMLCGGVTLYSPLKHNGCCPGKRVGIIGVGGLGHFGVMFAKAMGADKVVAISRKTAKNGMRSRWARICTLLPRMSRIGRLSMPGLWI